jgi:hypothetical protein
MPVREHLTKDGCSKNINGGEHLIVAPPIFVCIKQGLASC